MIDREFITWRAISLFNSPLRLLGAAAEELGDIVSVSKKLLSSKALVICARLAITGTFSSFGEIK